MKNHTNQSDQVKYEDFEDGIQESILASQSNSNGTKRLRIKSHITKGQINSTFHVTRGNNPSYTEYDGKDLTEAIKVYNELFNF